MRAILPHPRSDRRMVSWFKRDKSPDTPEADSGRRRLSAEEIAAADMVILTKDIGIKFEERFTGKTIVRVNISDAVKRAEAIMNKIDAHLAQTA